MMHSFHDKFSADRSAQREAKATTRRLQNEDMKECNPRKDNTIIVPKKLYEFQFYSDFDLVLSLSQKIQIIIDNYEVVPEALKNRF